MSDISVDQFLEACGTTEAIRLVVEHPSLNGEHTFHQPFVLIGRNPAADLHIDDKNLANRHAYLQMIAGRLLFVDFEKKSESQQAGWLDPGQSLEIGPLRIRLHEAAPRAGWLVAGHPLPYLLDTLPSISLNVFGRGLRSVWRMKRPMALVGNSTGCKIRLTDSQVSNYHCALVKTPQGLWAVDLLSTNGITVNGAKMRASQLKDGDLLRVGRFSICPRYECEPSTGNGALPSKSAALLGILASPNPGTLSGFDVQSQDSDAPTRTLVSTSSTDRKVDSESAVSPLVIQLAQMQQQMFSHMQQQMADQFQQAMGLFVDAFWAMYREQSELTRKELKRIRKLTRELTALQAELAKIAPAGVPQPEPPAKSGESPAALPSKTEPVGSTSRASPPPPPSGENTPKIPHSQAEPTAPLFQKPGAKSPADMHAWLSARVSQIQRERQSSWQRLLNLFQAKQGLGDQGLAKTESPKSTP